MTAPRWYDTERLADGSYRVIPIERTMMEMAAGMAAEREANMSSFHSKGGANNWRTHRPYRPTNLQYREPAGGMPGFMGLIGFLAAVIVLLVMTNG